MMMMMVTILLSLGQVVLFVSAVSGSPLRDPEPTEAWQVRRGPVTTPRPTPRAVARGEAMNFLVRQVANPTLCGYVNGKSKDPYDTHMIKVFMLTITQITP
jgi:hypothetical protein